VCIGGIYALERVARDSPTDHPTVMEVLTTFVREHSREQRPSSAGDKPDADAPGRGIRPDVQAAVTVIGRRNPRHDRQPLNLYRASLSGANLAYADLTEARLMRANLTGANLIRASLSGANLTGPFLVDGHLSGAILDNARLLNANLSGADLTRAVLSGADLTDADLMGADLTRANLTRAGLTRANLTGALRPPDAVVPEGWQRDTGSGRLKRTDTGPEEAGD
jgi:hypothetical protein